MAQKDRVFFSSSRNGKGTLLRRGKGGFAPADSRPLILGFLVCCGEGGLRSGEDSSSWRTSSLFAAAFLSFLLLLYFSVF